MSTCFKYALLILAVLFYAYNTSAIQNNDEGAIYISLANYNPQNQSNQVFESINDVSPWQNVIININDVSYKDIEFFVIQVHSFKHNNVLSDNKNFIVSSYVNGTNIGLVQLVTRGANSYQFYLKNEQTKPNNTIYVAVLPYKRAPIPGGCNMEFMTEIAPYQELKYTDALITVDAQAASFSGYRCESQVVQHEIYQMYLDETDFTEETYIEGIKKMLTVDNIQNYGYQVSKPTSGFLRKLYNAYRGTGSVYVVVATVNNSRSAYVPIVSYACDINNPTESCDSLTTTVSKILCSLLVFVGLFTCFHGHKFFKTEMFLVGSLVGAYIGFLVLSVLSVDLNGRDMILSSLSIGLGFGLVWLGLWWFCGIPVLSTLLPLFVLGYLVASISFYGGMGDLTIVNNNITYWGFFLAIILLCMTIFTGFMDKANILACAIVGSYACIIPVDHYVGSNLKYIFINTYRRVTVDNYEMAVINAPYQSMDVFLTIVWISMAVIGVLYQLKQQEGRPPFPPASSRLNRQPLNERTPLLMPTSSLSPSDRIILIHSAPSDY